jgi:hypothetical protein
MEGIKTCEQTSIRTYIYLYPIVVWKSDAVPLGSIPIYKLFSAYLVENTAYYFSIVITTCGRSVVIVRSRTKVTELVT